MVCFDMQEPIGAIGLGDFRMKGSRSVPLPDSASTSMVVRSGSGPKTSSRSRMKKSNSSSKSSSKQQAHHGKVASSSVSESALMHVTPSNSTPSSGTEARSYGLLPHAASMVSA